MTALLAFITPFTLIYSQYSYSKYIARKKFRKMAVRLSLQGVQVYQVKITHTGSIMIYVRCITSPFRINFNFTKCKVFKVSS